MHTRDDIIRRVRFLLALPLKSRELPASLATYARQCRHEAHSSIAVIQVIRQLTGLPLIATKGLIDTQYWLQDVNNALQNRRFMDAINELEGRCSDATNEQVSRLVACLQVGFFPSQGLSPVLRTSQATTQLFGKEDLEPVKNSLPDDWDSYSG